MNTLFIILLLLSLAGLGVGLINPVVFKWTRKKISLVFGSAIIVCFVLVGISGSSSTPPVTTTTTAPTEAVAPAPDQTASAPVTASAPAKKVAVPAPAPTLAPAPHVPVVLLQVSGSGTKSTQTFTAPSSWTLDYTYNCSGFSDGTGNFQVYIYNADGSPSYANGVNELGAGGSDTEYYHQGGPLYLEVNSECSWMVTAKG